MDKKWKIVGGNTDLTEEDKKIIDEYVNEKLFKEKHNLPQKSKPIVSYDGIYGLGDVINHVPLCPHCGEWSYYITRDAEINGGYTVCPFCKGFMYMEDFFVNK